MCAFPIELRNARHWVGSREEVKIPVKCIPENGHLSFASTSDSTTWCSYEEALDSLKKGYIKYLGFVFTEDLGIVAIDIDDGKDEYNLPSDLAIDIMHKCRSYTEESKSGRGYHILLKGKLPFLGKNNRNGVEIYKGGRYFIMTGKQRFYEEIIENQEAIDYVVSKYFSDFSDSAVSNNEKTHDVFCKGAYSDKPIKGTKISFKQEFPEIKQGSRNLSLLSIAGQFKAKGLSKEQVTEKLVEINKEKCIPPLSYQEIQSIVKSCFKYK